MTIHLAGSRLAIHVCSIKPLYFTSARFLTVETGIKIYGDNLPNPVGSFDQSGLNKYVLNNFQRMGYEKPTTIQQYALPLLLQKRDLLACAETGSGKTAAFLAPIFNHLQIGNTDKKVCQPLALILAPTRELARQIFRESKNIGRETGTKCSILHGGSENYRHQMEQLKNGTDILIATPGRLIDMINQGAVNLSSCRSLVLDEADRMLEMGFEEQLKQILETSNMPDRLERHSCMFSATFPDEIRAMVTKYLKDDYAYLSIGSPGTVPTGIEQQLLWVSESKKPDVLVELLEKGLEPQSLKLIFVDTKMLAKSLTEMLNKHTNYSAVTIHGNLSQRMREENLKSFAGGRPPVIVATSVAARGIDIPNVKQVINYTLPTNIMEYVHRIGRTGRKGLSGLATSFCNEKDAPIFKDLCILLKAANSNVPDFLTTNYKTKIGPYAKKSGFAKRWQSKKAASGGFANYY